MSGDAAALREAWALKDRCYAAWSSAPADAVQAADALAALRVHAVSGGAGAPALREIEALACWTRAIAQLVQGAMADAIASLDAAAEAFDAIGRGVDAAQTRVPRIMALSMLGRHDDAVACAQQALARFVALGDTRSAAKVSLNLGSLQLRHDAYADAAPHYRQAAVLFARLADHEHSVMADIGVADALAALGDVDEAELLYARAGMRASSHALPVLQALVDESTALLDLARGRYGAALAGFESARRRYETLQMPQHLAIAEKQLADAYLELRLLPEALALYGPALARMQALAMRDDEAWTLAQRGRAQAMLHDADAAAASFERAAAVFAEQDNAVGIAAVALARAELALAALAAGDAAALARQAATGFRVSGLAGAELRAEILLAEARLAGGEAAGAGADFARLLAQARGARMLSAQVRCLAGGGESALARGDIAGARSSFTAAIALFEAQRRALPGDDVRIAFLTDHLRPYQAMLQLALDDDRREPDAAHAATVLCWTDRVRARALGERLRQGEHAAARVPGAAERTLRARVQWLTRRLQQQHDEGEAPAALEAQLHEAEAALLEAARRERLAQPVAEAFDDDGISGADLAAALRAALGAADVLVEYGVAAGSVYACIVRPDGVAVRHALAPLADVQQALEAARFQIESPRHGAALLAPHLDRLAARARVHLLRLHALLWAPLALDGAARVLVVAPGVLGGVPFAALHDGTRDVGDRHDLALAPSAEWARQALLRTPRRPDSALVVGDGSRLAHAETEVRAVAARFGRATVLDGAAADADALARHAGAADVLHLACHAEFRSDNPMFSALHLRGALLTAESLETLSLPDATVVLSACETGLAGGGDEHVGLVRAFFAAGAARVVASLWPVDDAATADFMDVFYTVLRGGATPSAALRAAQATLKSDHPHAYFWAGFAVHGGW